MKRKNYGHVKNYRNKRKSNLVESFGGKCVLCGYNKCNRSLHFHHINPETKKFELMGCNGQSIIDNIEEAKKCIMVCSNCHWEIHDNLILHIPVTSFDEILFAKLSTNYSIPIDKCPICDNEKKATYKYCSVSCKSKADQKVNWQEIDLVELLKTKNMNQIAKEFGISFNAVKKHVIKMSH